MKSSRRRFMKMAGIAALGLGAQPMFKALAPASEAGPQPQVRQGAQALEARQWAMVIDTRRLKTEEAIEPLIEACHSIHNVPHLTNPKHEIKWIWETHYHSAFPGSPNPFQSEAVEARPFVVLCNHCQNPPCVRACPTQATFKRESDGIVLMDFHRCIGCRFCMAACPFGARSFNFVDPRPAIAETNLLFPTRMKGVVEKCNFCAERLARGEKPKCVEEAEPGRMLFGAIDSPEIRDVIKSKFTIRRKQHLGTEPSVFYIA
jgi:Fe-S-cluster-containing dehydrogenase component